MTGLMSRSLALSAALVFSLTGLLGLDSSALADDSVGRVVLATIGQWKVIRHGGAGNSHFCVLANGQGDDLFQIVPSSDPSFPYLIVGRSEAKWRAVEALKNESERIQVSYQLDGLGGSKRVKANILLFSVQENANLRQAVGFKIVYALVPTAVPRSEIVESGKRVTAEYSLAGFSDVVAWWAKPECR